MGFYSHWVLPRLLDLSMRQERLMPYRRQTVSGSEHTVLEVGVGSGLNLRLYRDVDFIYALDPSLELIELSELRMKQARQLALRARASAEALPFKNESFHTVVITWTLWTIAQPVRAFQEMHRVLRRDEQLLFVEHGLAPELRVVRWQNRLTPLWKRISGGCHLNRKMDELIRSGGFEIVELHKGYMRGPKPMTYMYEGRAQRA